MLHTIKSIIPICRQQRATGHKLVLATGFFDLLHAEHINFLTQARAEGDILIVAVESDARARILKGESRPVEIQTLRAQNLLSLTDKTETLTNRHADTLKPHKIIDFALLLPDNFNTPDAHQSLIQAVRPDILAVSSHTDHQEAKSKLVEEFGGELVVVHPHNPNISTTKIIKNVY